MFISGLPEKDVVNGFTHGASELVGVALIIGLARAVNIILEQGMISDTILDYMTHLVGGMNGGVFIIGQLIVFIFLGLVVPSSSGLAVLAMPIMAPLLILLASQETLLYRLTTGDNILCCSSHRQD